MKDFIRIGNAGGFWGDDLDAFRRQLEGGDLDYISMDFLAEITMSILKKQQLKNPELGYVTDFVDQIVDNAALIKEKNVTVLSNAGGINPSGCAKAILEKLKAKNIELNIAVIEGDTIIDRIDEWYPEKAAFRNLDTGEDFAAVKDKIQSANAYLGIPPLLKALSWNPDVIIAGRVTDTSVTMAPMIYEFGWKADDWDKLASTVIAGHIIECGAQGSGGNFTDWQDIPSWTNFGYPIVEVYPDSSFVVTKHDNTGGLVSVNTVKEQLVYEMGDPAAYISPDVVADFRTIRLSEEGTNRVRVRGVKGYPSTKQLKVSMAYEDGFKASASIIISGGEATEKAEVFADMFWDRLGLSFEKTNTEYIGFNACHLDLAPVIEPNEILLRFSVYDHDKTKINEFGKQIAPLILSGPPGVAVTGGRPRPQSVMTYYPALVDKELIDANVLLLNSEGETVKNETVSSVTGFESGEPLQKSIVARTENTSSNKETETVNVKLKKLCLARSGDKGDSANIGVIARNKTIYDFIKAYLTPALIKSMFREFCKGKVERFELDNIFALNFMLYESLDGGGTKSLMIDAQGKTFAQALLNQYITAPKTVVDSLQYSFFDESNE